VGEVEDVGLVVALEAIERGFDEADVVVEAR
jgi:hypothetical protein